MTLHHGDCLDVMAGMEPESVDAIVTDPPYGLEFMGKEWDRLGDVGKTSHSGPALVAAGERGQYGKVSFSGSSNVKCRACGKWQWDHVGRKCECERPDFPNVARHQGMLMGDWHARWAEAAYRVAKPSAYLLAFGGTRTVHRMTVALEDAGWIIRDMLVWAYASGFPKSKASLKPAWEPIVMARKPGPLRMLAIDECRIGFGPGEVDDGLTPCGDEEPHEPHDDEGTGDGRYTVHTCPGYPPRPPTQRARALVKDAPAGMGHSRGGMGGDGSPAGRWPANVILTDPIFDGGVEGVVGGGETSSGSRSGAYAGSGAWSGEYGPVTRDVDGDSGTYSRFFLVPKADRADREPVLGGLPERAMNIGDERPSGGFNERLKGTWSVPPPRQNVHPTVKPVDLMRHLVRLVTPTGGTVLDPFLGSGTTAIAAEMEGFGWVGIEREAEYVAIAEARLNGVQRGLGLDTPAPTPRMPNTHPDLSKHQPKQRAPGENWSGRWAGTLAEEEPA